MDNCFKITDDRFQIENIEQYNLVFEIQFSRLRFALAHNSTIFWLEDYFLGLENDIDMVIYQIRTIIENHSFLKAAYWKTIHVVSDFEINTLIPKELFTQQNLHTYIESAFPTSDNKEFEYSHSNTTKQIFVFGLLKKINNTFREIYNARQIFFESASAINLNYYCQAGIDNFSTISETSVTFYKTAPKSKLITTLKVGVQEIGLLPTTNNSITVFGEITPFSHIYQQMEEHGYQVLFKELPVEIKLSQYFADIATQRYFHILSLAYMATKV